MAVIRSRDEDQQLTKSRLTKITNPNPTDPEVTITTITA